MRNIPLLLLMLLLPLWVQSRVITIVADIWPPYTMDPVSGNEGYLIDIARAIFEPRGDTIIYKVKPYKRAIEEVKSGVVDAVAGMYKTDVMLYGLIAPENELGISINSFFGRNNLTWRYDPIAGNSPLKEIRIGVIAEYVFIEIEEYLQENKHTPKVQYLYGPNPLKQNMKKLLGNRVDVILDDSLAIVYTSQEIGIEGKIKPVGSLPTRNEVSLGFSPILDNSKENAEIVSNGIIALRESGKLSIILGKYGLKEWHSTNPILK